MTTTPEDERRYQLPPLPEVEFPGLEECLRRNADYEAKRRGYRSDHPHQPKQD